ncbi:hypothetical protein NUACC21_69500 [Scytonema sp. NUACC21]
MTKVNYIGRILDTEKQAPINGAKVSIGLPGEELVVYTDLEGIYKFPIDFGNCSVLEGEIKIEAKGYKTYSAFIRLSPQNKDLGDIRLVYPHHQESGKGGENSENSEDSENNIALPIVAAIMVVFALIVAALTLPSPQESPQQEIPENSINLPASLNFSKNNFLESYFAQSFLTL